MAHGHRRHGLSKPTGLYECFASVLRDQKRPREIHPRFGESWVDGKGFAKRRNGFCKRVAVITRATAACKCDSQIRPRLSEILVARDGSTERTPGSAQVTAR